ncbi:hypothetical protein V6D52_13410 [Idiomarina loihiensis]|uniref:hypothetical protein n=1 Tax=Idiomarina loihiensis TaxID=135577 RepID=UPI0039BE2DDF
MAIVNRIALDLAKDFIQVLALDDNEQEVFNKKLRSNAERRFKPSGSCKRQQDGKVG